MTCGWQARPQPPARLDQPPTRHPPRRRQTTKRDLTLTARRERAGLDGKLDGVANKRKDKPEPVTEQNAAEELVRQARDQGLSLTGPDGLLKQLTKTVL